MSPVARAVRAHSKKVTSGQCGNWQEHYHKSPDLITEKELRQYFLYLKNVKHHSRNTLTIAICGLKTKDAPGLSGGTSR